VRYCTNCGNPLAGTPRFCTRCGAQVSQAAELELPAPEATPLSFDRLAPEATPPAFEPPAQAASPVFESSPQEAPPPVFEPSAERAPPWMFKSPAPEEATQAFDSRWPGEGPQPGLGAVQPPTVDLPPAEARPWPVPPGPPPGNPPRSTSKIIAVIAGALILVAGGGLAAWTFLGHHSERSAGPLRGGALTHRPKGAAPSQSPQASTPSPAPSPSQTPPSTTGVVTIAPGVSQQSDAAQVASFLQTFFTAINNHNYDQYVLLLQPRLRPTVAQFNSGYRGTRDVNATLTGLTTTAGGVAATVTFTSHQPADNSATHTACTDWNVTMYLQLRGNGYRRVSAPPGYHAHYVPCS